MIDAVVNATVTIYQPLATAADGKVDFATEGAAYRCHAARYSAREKSGFAQSMQQVPEGYAIVERVLDVKPGARFSISFDGFESMNMRGIITNVEPVAVLSVRLTQLELKASAW